MLGGKLGKRTSLVVGWVREMVALAFMVVFCSTRLHKGAPCSCILPPGRRDVAVNGKGFELRSRGLGQTTEKAKACDLHAQEIKDKQKRRNAAKV